MKIKYYFVTGETKEIETDENTYQEIKDINRQQDTINKREQRKKQSIESALEYGLVGACEPTHEEIELDKLRGERLIALPSVLATLNERQKDLVSRVFFHGQSLQEIATELGIKYQSVQDQLKVIYKNLKKLFEK